MQLKPGSRKVLQTIADSLGVTAAAAWVHLVANNIGAAVTSAQGGELTSLFVNGIKLLELDVSALSKLRLLMLWNTGTERLRLPTRGALEILEVIDTHAVEIEGLARQIKLGSLTLHGAHDRVDLRSVPWLQQLRIKAPLRTLQLPPLPDLIYLELQDVLVERVAQPHASNLKLLVLCRCRRLEHLDVSTAPLERVMIRGCTSLRAVEASDVALLRSAALRKWAQKSPASQAQAGQRPHAASLKIHEALRAYNWDNGIAGVRRILQRPGAALQTAQLAYWMARPRYYQPFGSLAQVPPHAEEGWMLLEYLEQCVSDGVFRDEPTIQWTDQERALIVRDLPARRRAWQVPPSLIPGRRAGRSKPH